MLVCKIWWVNCDKHSINNIGRTRRRAKTENTALGGSVPSIFVETVVNNLQTISLIHLGYVHTFPTALALTRKNTCSHITVISANLKVDCHISGKFLEYTSRALDWIGCFPNNIIRWISQNYPVDIYSRKRYASLFNWAYEVGDKLKKTFLTMSMNTASREKNAKPFALEFPV